MNEITSDIYKDFTPLPADIQGWNSNSDIFDTLIKEIKPARIIEVGSWKGASAITMAKSLKANGLDSKIVCVDTWLGALEFWASQKHTPERNLLLKNGYPQIYFQFLSNVVHEGFQEVILPFPNTSFIAARYFKANEIQAELIYIDASHEYEDVLSDCKEYWDVVAPKGIMFGDDWGWESVRKAVEEFANSKGLTIRRHGADGWILQKP